MANLDMGDSFLFTSEVITTIVTDTSAGNFALGCINPKNKNFIVYYVGRSDNDVAAELKNYLGNNYEKFKYSYASSPKEAFKKECKNYHEFGGKEKLDNKRHPDRPDGTNYKCPYCDIFD